MFQAAHKWLNSVHRVNSHIEPKSLDDKGLEVVLAKKLSDDRKMVSLAFQQFDSENTGTVSKHQLRKFLERFGTPFSKEQFERMVGRCQENSDGTVSFYEFMEKLGVDLQAGDFGFSEKITSENLNNEFDRFSYKSIRFVFYRLECTNLLSLLSVFT